MRFAPTDLRKDGTAYDVAIAVGILAASGQLPDTSRLTDTALLGELVVQWLADEYAATGRRPHREDDEAAQVALSSGAHYGCWDSRG